MSEWIDEQPDTQGTDSEPSGLAEYLDGLPVRARHYKYSDPISGKSVWRNECGTWNGQQPKGSVDLYDRQTVETALRTDRKAVLEEAAKVADERAEACRLAGNQGGIDPIEASILDEHLSEAAQAIRALAEGAGK